ncbi:hypothetical protein [Dysgonomonas sp. 521]|uniref:hypothetical protein n=1 Tax=Dysgonomonas sp. 521 TaxID=2302932 RepID=UPI0013D74811|nr:hypothetical protein [Dysgonomonas sp. 521]
MTLVPSTEERPPLYEALLKPYSSQYYEIKVKNIATGFSEYMTNGVCIYVPEDVASRSFEKLPCVGKIIYEKELHNIEIVEARGTSIRDGFRVKKGYEEKIATALDTKK